MSTKKRKKIICAAVAILLVLGVGTAYLCYESKYVRFQDEYMEERTCELLGKKKILKTDMEELTSFEIDTTFTHITTLEDLKKFPDLSILEILFTVNLQSEEARQDFKNLASKSGKLHQREQKVLADTLPELKNLEKIFLGSGVVCYDLTAFENCNQIEELWISNNFVENIDGIEGMKKLRILDISDNLVQDISELNEVENLEAVCLTGTPIENLEVLLELPSLKVVCYETEEEEQMEILEALKEKGIIVRSERGEFAEALENAGIDFIGAGA